MWEGELAVCVCGGWVGGGLLEGVLPGVQSPTAPAGSTPAFPGHGLAIGSLPACRYNYT